MKKLQEVAELFRKNSLAVHHSKRYLHILRSVVNFRASSAEFIKEFIGTAAQKLGGPAIQHCFQPLVEDLAEATRLLQS